MEDELLADNMIVYIEKEIVRNFTMEIVCIQDETNRLTLLWAHNLFVMWTLDVLPWVILA